MLPSIRFFSKCIKLRRPFTSSIIINYRNNSSDKNEKSDLNKNKLGDMSYKYQIYEDKDSEVILDVYEERLKYSNLEEQVEEDNRYVGLNLERGVTGVYDIEDLVEVLKREKSKNIFVATVPKEHNYVDYICIVSGNSVKHMFAIAQFVRRVYKQKRSKGDVIPKLEGENSKDWMALDLGNIALHIFSEKARELYDLETLWTVGAQYDDEYNKPEPVSDMLEKQSIYLSGLEPAS